MAENTQHKLDRVRPPRVQITYDVEIGDAIVMKELPYVIGILADLSGKPLEALPPVKKRKFVEIDRDSFGDVMSSISPHVSYTVPNVLANDNTTMSVSLVFHSMDDFDPVAVLKQVKVLDELYSARVHLNDLLGKLDGNEELHELLSQVLTDPAKRNQLKADLGIGAAPAPADKPAEAAPAPADEKPKA